VYETKTETSNCQRALSWSGSSDKLAIVVARFEVQLYYIFRDDNQLNIVYIGGESCFSAPPDYHFSSYQFSGKNFGFLIRFIQTKVTYITKSENLLHTHKKKSRQKTAKKLVGRGGISKLSPIAMHSSYESFAFYFTKKKVNFVFSSIPDRFLLWKSSIRHPITISQLKFMQTHKKTVKNVSKNKKKGFPFPPSSLSFLTLQIIFWF
jgi:hypothetical protein